MIIAHNMAAMNTQRNLKITGNNKNKALERLSSGYKINRAADNAAGLAISEEMRGQIRGLNKGSENTKNGMSFCQVADGAMQEMNNIIHRMRELSVQAANDTNVEADREAIQVEMDALIKEVDRISDDTEFNTIKVFAKSRRVSTYDTSGGDYRLIHQQVYQIAGNNYGIAEVIGQDHLSQSEYMDEKVEFSGTGWHNTGKDYYWSTKDGQKNDIATYMNNTYGIDIAASAPASKGTVTVNGTNCSAQLTYGGYDYQGNLMLTGATITNYDAGGNVTGTDKVTSSSFNHGTKGFSLNSPAKFNSAFLDFSGLGTDYQIGNLYGQGFSTICSHGCGVHYSIELIDGNNTATTKTATDGTTKYNYSGGLGQNKVLQVDINGCTSGNDIVKRIFNAANSENANFNSHYNQFAYKDGDSKLYIYESDADESKSLIGIFEPASWSTDGYSKIIDTIVDLPGNLERRYEDADLWIQMGSNSNQGVELERPWIDSRRLGIKAINVTTQQGAAAAIDVCSRATDILDNKRADMGAYYNRFEYAVSNADNMSENLQSAESKLRDADMADEMVTFSAQNILEQAGMSVLAQANQSKQGILSLLS